MKRIGSILVGNLAVALVLFSTPLQLSAQQPPGAGSRGAVTETASGLLTTTFDTLVGTVTVNLPDDLAAGDVISGSVIADPKGQTEPEKTANQSELNGYVVEVDKEKVPADNQYAKLLVPVGVASIPLILRNREGTEVGRVQVPVKPTSAGQGPSGKPPVAQVGKAQGDAGPASYQTPAIAQAGKPVAVKGVFDGNSLTSGVTFGGKAARILAESPRQIVAASPSGVVGSSEIEVTKQGKVVARCAYQSVGVRLSAAKLHLTRGEETTVTATISGLAGMTSPVEFELVNRSPGSVQLKGGDVQRFTVDPKQASNGGYVTTRTLTGLKAGGFSIKATVNGGGLQRCALPETPIVAPSPGDDPALSPRVQKPGDLTQRPGPQPTPQPTPTPQPPPPPPPPGPAHGRFRVTINGFLVNHQTNDGIAQTDGAGDEVTLVTYYASVVQSGGVFWGGEGHTSIMGQQPTNAVKAGRVTEQGGLQTEDGFPTQDRPWLLHGVPGVGVPPAVLFEREITQGVDASVVIPTIWEWDSSARGSIELMGTYEDAVHRDQSGIATAVSGMIRVPPPLALSSFLRPGAGIGIHNTMSVWQPPLGLGALNKPIGMQLANGWYVFTPQALVLTYESALYLSHTDFGHGPGIVDVRYQDDRSLDGDYTLFLEVDELNADGTPSRAPLPDTGPPGADSVSGTFTYTDTEADPGGGGSTAFPRPIVRCRVQVWRAGGLASTTETDASGSFRVTVPHLPDGTDTTVLLYATNPAAQVLAGAGTYFVSRTLLSRGATPLDFSENFTTTEQIRSFNAAHDIRLAHDFAQARRDPAESEPIPFVDVSFIDHELMGTHYNPEGSGLAIRHDLETRDLVIMHEYAHFLEDKIGSFLLLPSYHDGCHTTQRCLNPADCADLEHTGMGLGPRSPTTMTQLVNSPENAWMEGFADYFTLAVKRANPMGRFNLTWGGTPTEADLDTHGECAAVGRETFDGRTINGEMVENYVACVLWAASTSPGSDTAVFQIFDHELDGSATHTLPNIQRFHDAWVGRGLDHSRLDSILRECRIPTAASHP